MFCALKMSIGMILSCAGESSAITFALGLPLCSPIQILLVAWLLVKSADAWPDVRTMMRARRKPSYADAMANNTSPLMNIVPPPVSRLSPGAARRNADR